MCKKKFTLTYDDIHEIYGTIDSSSIGVLQNFEIEDEKKFKYPAPIKHYKSMEKSRKQLQMPNS